MTTAIPAAPTARGVLTQRGVVALAGAAAAGAWWHPGLPLLPGVVGVALALVARRPVLLVGAVFVVAAAMGQRAVDGLAPVGSQPFEGTVTMVSDPKETAFGARADVRVGSKRVEARANGAAAGALLRALSGERLHVSGRLGPPPPDSPWLVPRHVVGRLSVDEAEAADGGVAPLRAANRFRRLLVRGAQVMPEPARSLYGGFVLGDDRGQRPETVDDFRGAGLTHLLVVSGQNVAFVLLLLTPLTSRVGLVARWAVSVTAILAFATLTRFEPSILRASAMALVSVTATTKGRPTEALRTLALGLTGLILIDPLIVRSVAFQLSTAASAGIIFGGHRISAWLRGPRWWRDLLGVTLAAQLGVAPVLVPRFGAMPVVSIPANLLAVPLSGLVTTWGLPAGVVAGVLGPGIGAVVHWPTRVVIGWVAGVARVGAALPLGEIDGWGIIGASAAAAAVVLAPPLPVIGRVVRSVGVAALAAVLLGPAFALRTPPVEHRPTPGAVLYRAGGATVLEIDGQVWLPGLLEGLRRTGARRLDLLVLERPSAEIERALAHRWDIGKVIVVGEQYPVEIHIGGLVVAVGPTSSQVHHSGRPP